MDHSVVVNYFLTLSHVRNRTSNEHFIAFLKAKRSSQKEEWEGHWQKSKGVLERGNSSPVQDTRTGKRKVSPHSKAASHN